MTKDKRETKLREIKDEILNLKGFPLCEYRKANNYKPVIGQGNHNADIVFVGEAPGKNEAETGYPFCGMSGKILDELLLSINTKRDDV